MTHSLDDFFKSHDWELLHRLNGWTIRRDDDLVTFESSARDGQRFTILCTCDNYPVSPPEVVFVNQVGSAQESAAWPKGTEPFHAVVKLPPASFLCMPLVRAGLSHHPEWKSNPSANPWNPESNTLMDIFNFVDQLLKSTDYIGRGE